jgi:glutamine amidotransferase
MIVIIDYGMGNLRSAQKGFEKAGHEAILSSDPKAIDGATGVVLPGVGAFKDCFTGLDEQGFVEPVLNWIAAGNPLLGICVGMQLLFEYGEEGEGSPGLGVFEGHVIRFPDPAATGLKVPHMGWNRLEPVPENPNPILANLAPNSYVYFVHSYHADPTDRSIVSAESEYGVRFPAVVGRENVFATQFHPEKSQRVGIGILKAFGDFVHNSTRSAAV